MSFKYSSKIKIVFLMFLVCFPAVYASAQDQSVKRCEAITQKGTHCKNRALRYSSFCQVHKTKSPSVQQCKAKTKNRKRCSREAKISGYCTQHYKINLNKKF